MGKENKRRGGRAYLNDFERDLTGRYHYRGRHYRYAGEMPRRQALALMWAAAGGSQLLLAAAGFLDGQGLGRSFYVLLPYAGAFVANVSVCWALGRITAGGEALREYVHERSVARLPLRSLVTALLAGAAALMCLVHMALHGAAWQRIAFLAMTVTAAGAQLALRRFLGRARWQCGDDGQMSPEEKQ